MQLGATLPEMPRERRDREQLVSDLESSPLKGAPLPQRLRNFRPHGDAAARAIAGPPIWMTRLRAIEDATEQHERRLGEAWRSLAMELTGRTAFARAWRELAAGWSFADINEMIETHNRCFPVESRLPMDPRTRDYVRIDGRSYDRELLDADWILERFPADRVAALTA